MKFLKGPVLWGLLVIPLVVSAHVFPATTRTKVWGQDMWHLGAEVLLAVGSWRLGTLINR
jgi:hypothetical protein